MILAAVHGKPRAAHAQGQARPPSVPLVRAIALFLLVSVATPSMAGHSAHLALQRIGHPQFEAKRIHLDLLPAGESSPVRLRIQIEDLYLHALQQRFHEVRFECEPAPVAGQAQAADSHAETEAAYSRPWRCEGPLRWRGGRGWRLAWQADAAFNAAEIRLHHDGGELELHLPLGGLPLRVVARRAPATWLAALLPQLQWQSGRIDAALEQREDKLGGSDWKGQVRVRALDAQSQDGVIAVAGVELSGPVQARVEASGRLYVQAEPVLAAGELLAGAIYMEWPQGSRVEWVVHADGMNGLWRLSRLQLRDSGLELDGEAEFSAAQEPWLRGLDARLRIDLGRHYTRYLDGAMASIGQAGLNVEGRLEGHIVLSDAGRLERLDAQLDEVDLSHPEGRYALGGVSGNLAFRRDRDDTAPVELSWRRIQVHALEFQPGRLRARTEFGEFRMREALRLGLFGGEVVADDLVLRPLAEQRDRIEASLQLNDIDIARVTSAFDWPAFSGRLDGRLPELRYVDKVLTAGGEIDIRVFDGQVRIQNLGVERPFGIAPALAADVRIDRLDLEPMTQVFGFGRIEGRLNGQIDGLRLIDWRPVAFDAQLRTSEQGRRRISQLAVNQLTEIGGGGAAAGVQGRLLGVFDSFGYRRIGLACRLRNEICEMSGLDDSAGGYTILQGSGLPLITIRGFQRRVDWPVLVERLRALAAGQSPEIG